MTVGELRTMIRLAHDDEEILVEPCPKAHRLGASDQPISVHEIRRVFLGRMAKYYEVRLQLDSSRTIYLRQADEGEEC